MLCSVRVKGRLLEYLYASGFDERIKWSISRIFVKNFKDIPNYLLLVQTHWIVLIAMLKKWRLSWVSYSAVFDD